MSGSEVNTSATGGYIIDRPPVPPTGAQITTALQVMVAQLADLPGTLVRPRWQPMPPTQPSADTTWAAVGVTQTEMDEYPYIVHDPTTTLSGQANPGVDRMQRHSTLTVIVSFYGPEADDCASRFRDAFYVPQNMEPLASLGIKMQSVADLVRSAEIINQQYIDRFDLRVQFRQIINRVYPIFDIAAAEVDLGGGQTADGGTGIVRIIEVTEDTILIEP
jgi:hypothetical protein